MQVTKRSKTESNGRYFKGEISESLPFILPGFLVSVLSPMLRGFVVKLELMAHGQDRVDDSPLKMVLETLRRSQQNLSESVHGMSSEEQLYYAYMIHNLSTSLVGYQGSLQSSEEVHALVSLLLSIGHSPEGDLCKLLFEEDVFSFVVPAFASMVLDNGVVLVRNPTMIEAFQEIDSLSLSWVTKIKVSLNDAEQQHVLDRMGLTDSSINVQSEECEKSDKIIFEEIDGEVSTVKKVSSSFSHAVGEGRSVLVRFLLAGRKSWATDSGVVETGGKNGGEQRARSILSTSNEGSRENVSHLLARLRKLAFPSQEIIGFFGKCLLREGRDGFKSHSSPELDQLSDVLTSGPDLSLTYFNSHDSGQIAVDSRLIFVQKGKESMKIKCEEKLVKTKHAAGYSNSNTNVNIPAATQHALLGEPHDLRTILPPTDIQCRLPPAPPHPPYPNLWCWKRLLDSVANTHNYISNACQQVLEELDTECHETICHAIACVFRGQPAAILIQILHNNVSPRLFGIQDKHGNTPLHNAVIASNAMVVTELVTLYPLAIHTQNGELATPLDIAVSHKNNEVVDCLLRESVRSDPHSTRTAELLQSCLVTAMKIGYPHYLKTLLQLHSEYELTIDFEYTDTNGHTAWYYLKHKAPAVRAISVKLLQESNLSCPLLTKLLKVESCFCQSFDSGETPNVDGVTSLVGAKTSEPKHTSHSDSADEDLVYRNSAFTFEHKFDHKRNTDEERAETTLLWLQCKQCRSKDSLPCESTDSGGIETPSNAKRSQNESPSYVADLSSGSLEKDEPLPLSERKYPVTCETCEVNEGTISPVVVGPTVAAEPEEPHHLTLTTALAQIDRLKNKMNRLAAEKDHLAAENNNLVAEVEKLKEPHTSDEEHTMCPTACLGSTSESTDNSPFVTAADNVGTPDYTSAEESGGASGKNRPLRYPQPYTDSVTPSDDLSSPQKPSVSERVKRKQPKRRSLRPLATLRGRVDSFSEPEKSSPSSEENSTSTPPTSDIAVEERLAKLKTRHRCSGKRQVDWMSRSEKTPPLTVASFFGANGKFNKKILKRISSVIHKAGYCHLRYEIHQQLFPIFGFSPLKHKLTRRERKIARAIFDVVGKRDSIPPNIVDNLEVLEKILKDREQQDQVVAEDERGKKRQAKGAASLSSSKPQTLKPLTQSVDRENQPPDDTEVDGFTTPPTETPPSISYGSARPSAAETVVVPVFRAMVCEGRVSVPPRNPTVTEAFQQIDSLNSHQSWYQHFLECFEQTALVKNTSAAFDDPPFETDYVQDQVYSSRKTTFTTLNEERSGVNNSSTLVGKDSTTGDIGDEKGKHPTHSRLCININGAHTIPSSVTERFTRFSSISHNDSHVEGFYNTELSEAVAVALAVFLKQDFSSFSQKIMLLNGRDGSKSTALPEVDLTRDVYVESATGYECRSFDSQVTRATTIEKGVHVVKKAVEMKDMEEVKERAVPKVPFNNQTNAVSLASEGYSEDHGRNVVANASSELQPVASAFSEPQPVASAFSEPQPVASAFSEPQPVASAFSEPQPLLTCPPAPKPQPPPPTVWCWKRRLESLTNVHVFIGNAGPVALEELDTECQETICHAIACVFRDEDAVSLIHTLCNNNISPRLFCMQDKLGNTPLHNAVLHDNIMVAKELVGLDPSAISIRNCEHVTPLDIAVSKMNDEMVICLLGKCVLSDPHGTSSVVLLQSCLLKAMKTGHIYYLETLLKLHSAHGLAIDFECADGDGYTAWHHLKQKVPDARAAAIKLLKDSGLSEKLRRKLMLNADSCLDFSAEGPAAVPTAREIDSLQSVEDTDSPEERCAAAIDTSQSQSEQSMYSDEEKTSLNTVSNTECKSTTGIEMDVFDTSSDGGLKTLQSSPLHREHENDNPTILAPELYDAVSATDFGSDTVTEELNKEDASAEEPPHKGQMSLPCQGEKLVVSDNEIKPICVFHPYTSLQTSSIVSPLWRMRQKLKKAEVQKGKTVCYTRKNTSTFVSAIWTNRYHNPYLETRMLGKGLWFDLSCQQLNSQCHDTSLYGTTASTHNSVLPHSKASPPCYPAKERIEKEWTYAQPTQWSILTRQYTSSDRDFDSNKMPETKRNVHVPGYSPTRYTISSSMARYYFPLVAKAMLCSFAFKHSFVNNRNIAIHIKSAGTHVRRKTKFHCLESEVVNFKKHSFSLASRPVHLLHIHVELWVDDSADKSSKELCRTSESTVPWKVKSQNSTKPDPRFLPDQIQKYGCQSFDTSICTSSAEPEEQTYTFTDEPGLNFAPILLDSAFEELPISDTQETIDIREGVVQNGSNANVAASNTEPQEQQTDTCTDELFSLTLDSPCDPIPDTQEAIGITEEDIDENPEPCYDPKQISEFPSSIQPPPLAVTVSPVQESVDNTSPAQENNSLSEDAVEESRPELLERFKLEPNSHCESASFSSSKTSTNCSTDSQGCTSAKDTQQSDLPSSELPLRQKHSASGNRQRAESRILKCRCSSSESSESDSKEQSNDPPVHAATYSPSEDGSTKLCTSNITNSQPTDDIEVDGFTTPPTETPPSISYGSARPSAAETTNSPQCREEESSGLSVLEFTNSSNPLDVIHSHMKVYSKCCPRHDIRSVVIGTTYPPSDAFGPKRRYSSIKDIHSDPSHSQFDCTKKLSAQSSSNRHYRDSESQQIMFERPSPESVLRQNRGALPPKLHSPSLVQSLMETTESHPSPPLSSRQQTSQLHHPTENLAQGRSKNSEAAVVTVANREASAENPESTRRLENARSSIQSRPSTSFLDSQTVPRDHKERIRGTAELLHAQDYTRILPLAYEGDPPDSLPPLLKIPFVFITGLAYYKLSNHKKSVQFFAKCLALADDCGRDGDITICNIYIGDIDFAKRRYSEAAGRYQTALQHYSRESVAQDFRMVMPTRSAVWLKCGSALKNASRVGDSVAAYEKAIEIAASKKDQLSAHTSLGNLYQGIGENGRAVKEYEAAIELAQDLKDNVSLGWNHGNLGNALLGLHQRDKALHYLFKALDMAVEFETTPQAIGRAYNNLGTAFQSLNELAKAEEHYDLALAQAIYGNDIPGQVRVYGNIGNLQMLNKESIQKYYLQGTRDLEYVIKHHEENFSGIKGSSKGLSLSVSLFETNSRTFHRMQDCMVHIQKGEEQPIRYEDALLVAEQSRARTLGELMLRRRGPQLEHELMSPPSLFQMKAIVGRQSCPVVYLSYTGERLLGWLLYPTSDNQSSIVNMFEVPLSDNEFDGKSLDYHLRYSLNEQLVEKSFEMYKPFDYEKEKTEPLEKLYDLVARPVMRMLSTLDTKHSLQQGSAETVPVQHNRGKKKGGLRKIVVIPDSYTNLLPFTCVLNKDTGKFWGDDYYFQIMPSLLTMGILDQLPTVSVTIPVQYQQMLCVVGNPNIPRFKFNNEDWDLGKLPHATKEAEWVSHILQCKPILHEQATKDAVVMRIMNAKVIHLATHGSAVAGFLAFAGMTSSSSEAVDAKQVLIYPDEIESLNISPALVVLSSCDSGRGVFKADGIQGMARAFILAGAQAVLTALWRVPDESACIFMQFFYQYLVEGMRGTQALHKAILCLRCFSKYSQYIHWSGYQLTGRDTVEESDAKKKDREGKSRDRVNGLESQITGGPSKETRQLSRAELIAHKNELDEAKIEREDIDVQQQLRLGGDNSNSRRNSLSSCCSDATVSSETSSLCSSDYTPKEGPSHQQPSGTSFERMMSLRKRAKERICKFRHSASSGSDSEYNCKISLCRPSEPLEIDETASEASSHASSQSGSDGLAWNEPQPKRMKQVDEGIEEASAMFLSGAKCFPLEEKSSSAISECCTKGAPCTESSRIDHTSSCIAALHPSTSKQNTPILEYYRSISEPSVYAVFYCHGRKCHFQIDSSLGPSLTKESDVCSEIFTELKDQLFNLTRGQLKKVVAVIDTESACITQPFIIKLQSHLTENCYFQVIPYPPGVSKPEVPHVVPLSHCSGRNACIVGNPTIPPHAINGTMHTFPDLPAATKEAKLLSDLFNSDPLIHEEATKEAVKKRLRSAQFVNISTHTVEGEGLVFSDKSLLTVQDIEELKFHNKPPALVVLNCCGTADVVRRANGMKGLALAFIKVGVSAVISIHGKVKDDLAYQFSECFYHNLIQKGIVGTLSFYKAMLTTHNSSHCYLYYGKDVEFTS